MFAKMKKALVWALTLIVCFTVAACDFLPGNSTECNHEFGEWTTVEWKTCTTDGLQERTCEKCGEKEEQVVPAAHLAKADTYYQDSEKHAKICLYCKATFEEAVHEFDENDDCMVCGYHFQSLWEIPDHVLEIEEGRDVRVLVLADTQIIDSSQMRTSDRLGESSVIAWGPDTMEENLFQYMRSAVEKAEPDLILVVGDIIYGEFDDAGTSLECLIEELESYEVPWAPIYGNHENESAKGAKWQNQQLENAEHCLFMKGDTDGNGNYTIAIKQGDDIVRMFYMMDSNYCSNAYKPTDNEVITSPGFTSNQIVWLYNRMEALESVYGQAVSSTVCYHVPSKEFTQALEQYTDQTSMFTIGNEVKAAEGADDFGSKRSGLDEFTVPSYNGYSFLEILKKYSVDTVFCGHVHKVNTSVMYEGIRWTVALKTGKYDSHTASELGGTLMTFNSDGYFVKHLYHDATVQAKMDALRGLN